jgi:hypothetical protein
MTATSNGAATAALSEAAAPPAEDKKFGAGIGMFHSFRYGDFRWLWLGNTFSGAAMWVPTT